MEITADGADQDEEQHKGPETDFRGMPCPPRAETSRCDSRQNVRTEAGFGSMSRQQSREVSSSRSNLMHPADHVKYAKRRDDERVELHSCVVV